ncbi:MAG: Two-component hybrid sensor and regulator [Myxococcales bacterium]|nr:Two-component hybrid sensor and regulator [Myxococcales bacterium]
MSYRTFVEELARLRNPRTLMLGIVSGYAVTACFGALTAIGVGTGVLRWHWAFGALLGAKLCTNTLALIALRTDRYPLAFAGINVAADAVVMTGAIWATGDTASPLAAIYTIEVTVLALLTNLSVTIMVGGFALIMFVVMGLLTTWGVLPHFPTPAEWGGRSPGYLVLAFLFVAFVIGAPTFYTSQILNRLRENERRLEARTHALIDAGKEKAQFMANVTHELRTPLQGIMGLSDLVAKGIYGTASDKQREAMRELKASAHRLLSLIDDLLQLATYDAGKLGLKLAEVDLGEVLPSAISTAQWLVADKQLQIALDLEPVPVLVTDRGKLNQIVLNLLSNAIKFTPDAGSITLRARRDGDGVRIEIEDTGIGIAPADLTRVFDEFHQVDGSTSREYGGVGLGLSLVRRLLVLLGGTISVESTLGRGSTFCVRLPRSAPPAIESDFATDAIVK